MGPERLLRFCSTRGVRLTRLKAAEIVGAARVAFAMPETMSAVRLRILMADMELLAKLDQEISETEEQLAEILPETPADILTTLPRVSVVRGSNYGEALGDITRFRHAGQVYRLSGLVPRRYESAGKSGPPPRSRARERSSYERRSWSSARRCVRAIRTSPATPRRSKSAAKPAG